MHGTIGIALSHMLKGVKSDDGINISLYFTKILIYNLVRLVNLYFVIIILSFKVVFKGLFYGYKIVFL